jgi:hypothetical protein
MEEQPDRSSVDSTIPLCSAIPTIQSSIHLLPNSLHLVDSSLEFHLSALIASELIVKFFVYEDGLGFVRDNHYNIPDHRETIQPGLNQQKRLHMPLSDYSFEYTSSIPIVIEIENSSLSEITFMEIRANIPKILQQRVVKNKMLYEIREIFNPPTQDMDEREKACVVCMHYERNAIIEPCCHICLCERCANLMRTQASRKCPMCRQGNFYAEVVSFIKVNFS